MAVSDLIPTKDNKTKPSAEIQSKIARGRARLESLVPKRNECLEFWRNNPYVHVTQENVLVQTPTAIAVSPGQGRPPHKVRLTRNIILDVVAHEVSAATQRVPSYEINPSTNDPEDIAAASVAEKVALFGFDKWDVRRATVDAVTYAVVADEGFVWPYFDNTKGKVIDPKQGICEGEICLRVFGPNEVYWEPGTRFHDSPWHCVEQARPLESVQREFDVKELKPDATTSTLAGASKRRNASKMVLQTDYLERPTPKNKMGKRITVVNGKVMKEEAYPCWQFGPEELVLHRLSYFTDPDSDRDMGLVRHLLDAQRTILDCVNKEAEWKNLALNPQVILQNVVMDEDLTDEPGAVYHAYGSGQVVWRQVPPVPADLQRLKEEAKADIGRIAAQNDIPNQIDTAAGLQVFVERDQNRRQEFLANLADFHSRVMRSCLYLCQTFYTEKRLLHLRGTTGWETVKDFRGSALRDQIDVTVFPGSIAPRTRAAMQQQVQWFAQTFPGWLKPEDAWAAINGGWTENLIEAYELDTAHAAQCIQLIRGMADGSTLPDQIPVARDFDNHAVQLRVLETFMKTGEFSQWTPGQQEAITLLRQQHKQLEAKAAAEEQIQQMQVAQGLGMSNATKGPSAQMPSLPGGAPQPGGTPNGGTPPGR